MDVPGYLHAHIHENIMMEKAAIERRRAWTVVLGLVPKKDGNQWCILWGTNIQEGVCGFGETPEAALWDFEKAMEASIPLTPTRRPHERRVMDYVWTPPHTTVSYPLLVDNDIVLAVGGPPEIAVLAYLRPITTLGGRVDLLPQSKDDITHGQSL